MRRLFGRFTAEYRTYFLKSFTVCLGQTREVLQLLSGTKRGYASQQQA